MHELVAPAADVKIELGVPFSAMARWPGHSSRPWSVPLLHRVSLAQVLEMVRQFARANQDHASGAVGYLNPVERMGYEVFADVRWLRESAEC